MQAKTLLLQKGQFSSDAIIMSLHNKHYFNNPFDFFLEKQIHVLAEDEN